VGDLLEELVNESIKQPHSNNSKNTQWPSWIVPAVHTNWSQRKLSVLFFFFCKL